jgi:hypothetical protein
MKKRTVIILSIVAIIIIIVARGGCEFNVSTAKVTDVKICTALADGLCDNDNPVLSTAAMDIFASCILKHSVAETRVKFTWFYYGETKIEIDNVELNTGDKIGNLNLHSSLSRPNNGWPIGVYEVVIEVQTDNADPVVKQFSIE